MLKNMKIRKRLISVFMVAILLSSIAGIVGIVLMTKSDSDYSAVLENYGFAQGELGNLGRSFQSSRVLGLLVVTAPNAADRDGYLKELSAEDTEMDTYMQQVKARLGSQLGQQVYATLDTAMKSFRATRDELFTSMSGTDISANIALYQKKMAEPSEAVSTILDTMISDKSRIGQEKSVGLSQQMTIFRILMLSIIAIALVAAALLGYALSQGISRPIILLERAAARMAKGDYDVDLSFESRDEIGSLANSMREMTTTTKTIILDTARGLGEIEKGNFDIVPTVEYIGVFGGIKSALEGIIVGLSDTISQIGQAAQQVSSGADQVSSGAQALSQGATEQASSVEELAATITEISDQVRKNAENAAGANRMVTSVSGQIEYSNQQMADLTVAMAEISVSSQEIGKIIKTIEDIAFQTNILALNAAVEAARAGAAGKGFAVVADEVRNLASKSAQAAKNTTALIEGSIKAVDNGTHIADATAQSLAQVVTGVQQVAASMDDISSASNNQASSITQVTQGVDQISSVVQTNSATSEESAAASEELSGQARLLQELVDKFRLKGAHNSIDSLREDVPDAPMQFQPKRQHQTADKY